MSYRSNSAKLRRIMQQPGWWAAISSLGFHGLIFLVLSILPAPPSLGDDIDSSRTVSVVELSPGQTGRLPNFIELDTALPPLPEAPPPDPDSSDLGVEPFEFDLGPNIIESQRDFNLAPRTSPTYDFSDLFSNLPAPNVLNRRRPIPVPRTTRPLPAPTPIQPTAPEVVQPAPLPEATAEDLQPTPPAEQESPAEQPDPSEQPPQQTARASQSPPPQGIQLSEAQQERYEQLFTYNAQGTSGREAQDKALTWFTETLGRDIDDIDSLRNFLSLQVDYPPDTCAIGAEEGDLTATYGVVLGEDGNISERPELIRSAGYPVLNFVGRDAVEAEGSFSDATGPRLVRVDFIYSDAACAAAEAIARDSVPAAQPSASPATPDDSSAAPAAPGSAPEEGGEASSGDGASGELSAPLPNSTGTEDGGE